MKGSGYPLPSRCPLGRAGTVQRWWLSPARRYDHYSVLCELLPVSIPSLAICLQTLVNGEPPALPAWPGCPHLAPPARPRPAGHSSAGRWEAEEEELQLTRFWGCGEARASLTVRCPFLCPFARPPRGFHRRGKEEGAGCAGLGERAAGAEHLVRGTRPWQLHQKGCPGGKQGLAHPNALVPDPPGCWASPRAGPSPSLPVPFPSEGRGAFPGVEIYHMVEQVNGHLKESILKALEEER